MELPIDDDEMLAPVPAMASDEVLEDAEPAVGDGGFSDAQGVVRVWIDDDRLARVRVSTRWRSKLGDASLGDCFTEALLLANLEVASVPEPDEPRFTDVDFSELPRLSASTLAAFQDRFDEVEARWEEASTRADAEQPVEPPNVSGRSKGVTVTLNSSGRAATISFDEKWLASAELVSIRSHVLRASDRARARFVPHEYENSELAAIESEHLFLLTAFQAMLDPKERS